MKLIQDVTCPGCKKDFEVEANLDSLVPPKETTKTNKSSLKQETVLVEKPEIIEKEIIKTVAPKDQPFFKCKSCGDAHKNTNYSQKPDKKCQNCGTLNGDKTCKNCGNKNPDEFEQLTEEDLNELGIPDPPEKTHEHTEE